MGSVFSPYYAWARARGEADPLEHCAVNVALYGSRAKRWAMTERGARALQRTPDRLAIGASSIAWDGDALTLQLDERTTPWLRPVRGTLRIVPTALPGTAWLLDAKGNHWWSPIAPAAHIDVRLHEPDLTWSGTAYFDSNGGAEPLETAFVDWDWSRASHGDGTVVLYDVRRRDGTADSLALHFSRDGRIEPVAAPAPATLPTTLWGIRRATRADDSAASVMQTLEDTPFYARSLLRTRVLGTDTVAVHESLSLDRFGSRWVQMLLPFRMPRWAF